MNIYCLESNVLYCKYKYYILLKMLNVTLAENLRGAQKVLDRHCKILVAHTICLLCKLFTFSSSPEPLG